jgi:hypothetical protein
VPGPGTPSGPNDEETIVGFDVTEVQKALKGASYPASSDDLAERAVSNNAGSDLVNALREIDRHSIGGPDEVMHELRGKLGSS